VGAELINAHRRRDMMKPAGNFRGYANAPKNKKIKLLKSDKIIFYQDIIKAVLDFEESYWLIPWTSTRQSTR
jgi:hypothetical protein